MALDMEPFSTLLPPICPILQQFNCLWVISMSRKKLSRHCQRGYLSRSFWDSSSPLRPILVLMISTRKRAWLVVRRIISLRSSVAKDILNSQQLNTTKLPLCSNLITWSLSQSILPHRKVTQVIRIKVIRGPLTKQQLISKRAG